MPTYTPSRGNASSSALHIGVGFILLLMLPALTTAQSQPAKPIQSPNPSGQVPTHATNGVSQAQSRSSQATPGVDAGPNPSTTNLLKVVFTPSETPLKFRSSSNIEADIQNVSNNPIQIKAADVTLSLYAVLTPDSGLCAIQMGSFYNQTAIGSTVVLKPLDHIGMIFNIAQNLIEDDGSYKKNCIQEIRTRHPELEYPTTLLRILDFSPGKYDFFLYGAFTVCQVTTVNGKDKTDCTEPQRSFTQSDTFAVALGQTSIVLFAMLGGFCALLMATTVDGQATPLNNFYVVIFTQGPEDQAWYKRLISRDGIVAGIKVALGVVGACLLAAAFTVVASRLSDTHFPINITVQDSWGALTVGFISYFMGGKFIQWLGGLGGSGSTSNSPQAGANPPTSPTPATIAPVPAAPVPGPPAPIPLPPAPDPAPPAPAPLAYSPTSPANEEPAAAEENAFPQHTNFDLAEEIASTPSPNSPAAQSGNHAGQPELRKEAD